MAKTSIDIDQTLAAEAREVLRTRTLTETVHAALREVVAASRRRAAIEHFRTMPPEDAQHALDARETMWR
jgi:Arc/MetJ family transcription regulator